jgi:zinc transporter, ZIP family
MSMIVAVVVVIGVVGATLAGGTIPLRFQQQARLFLSFSAGTLVGLALLELIPEGLEAGGGDLHVKLLLVLGAFLVTMLLDKLHVLHPHEHGMASDCPEHDHDHAPLAMHGAIGLLIHSALDGLALAAALRQSAAIAVAVALALSAHKFADGLTTVSLVLAHHHRRVQAAQLLFGNAGALLVGLAIGFVLTLSERGLGSVLLVMAGFFLYLGASDLIPSLTTPVCRKRDVVATALGMAAIALVSLVAH